MMKKEIDNAIAVLIAKKLWRCTRAADLAAFQFGNRRAVTTHRGEPAEVGEFALHVQCGWRMTLKDNVIVARRDLYYPAGYGEVSKEIPDDFDWGVLGANRQDKLLAELFENGKKEFTVRDTEAGRAGAFRINLDDDMSLEIFPDDSLGDEHWRLFRPDGDAPHFVVKGTGVETH